MRDALGAVQSVLVLGGTSEIALATVRKLIEGRCRTVVLAVRNVAGAKPLLDDLRALGATTVDAIPFDALDTDGHAAMVDATFERFGDLDLVIVAFGVLGDQTDFDDDPAAAATAVTTNYVGAVSAGLAVANAIRRQGHGTIVALSSVAAVRARKSNFVYGSSKAGLDAFYQGLGDHLIGAGGRVLVVRPGFVHSKMTAGLPAQPFATGPDQVADAILAALQKNVELIYVPGLLRYILGVMRLLPRPVWRIISAR